MSKCDGCYMQARHMDRCSEEGEFYRRCCGEPSCCPLLDPDHSDCWEKAALKMEETEEADR